MTARLSLDKVIMTSQGCCRHYMHLSHWSQMLQDDNALSSCIPSCTSVTALQMCCSQLSMCRILSSLVCTCALQWSRPLSDSPHRPGGALVRLHIFKYEQVNAAVDDAASMAEDVARMLSAARSKGKLTTAERKRAQALMISVAVSAPYLPKTTSHTQGLGKLDA